MVSVLETIYSYRAYIEKQSQSSDLNNIYMEKLREILGKFISATSPTTNLVH